MKVFVEPGHRKTLINVCQSDVVSTATCVAGKGSSKKRRQQWQIPYSITPGREDLDKCVGGGEGGREGGRKEEREGGRKGGRKGCWEGGWERGWREGGGENVREGGGDRGMDVGREGCISECTGDYS